MNRRCNLAHLIAAVALLAHGAARADQILYSWNLSPGAIHGTTPSAPTLFLQATTDLVPSSAAPQSLFIGNLATAEHYNTSASYSYPTTPVTLTAAITDQTTHRSGVLSFFGQVGGPPGNIFQNLQFTAGAVRSQTISLSGGIGYQITLQNGFLAIGMPGDPFGNLTQFDGFGAEVQTVDTSNSPEPSCLLLAALGLTWAGCRIKRPTGPKPDRRFSW